MKRAALGNVSNTANMLRLSKDDNFASITRENKKLTGKGFVYTQPSQRASQTIARKVSAQDISTGAGNTTLKTTALDTLPVNPRKPPVRRNTIFQEPALPPLAELGPSVSNGSVPSTKSQGPSNISKSNSISNVVDTNVSHDQDDESSIHAKAHNEKLSVPNGTNSLTKVEGIYIEDNGEIKVYNPQKPALNVTTKSSSERQACPNTATGTEKALQKPVSNTTEKVSAAGVMAPYAQHDTTGDPEECWEEEGENYVDDGYLTTRSQLYGDNTTGGATVILFPEYSLNVRRELAVAKQIVESTRTVQDYEDECYDPTMVAEYGEEIFEYMKTLEV